MMNFLRHKQKREPRWIDCNAGKCGPESIGFEIMNMGKVLCGGVDVTDQCFYASEDKGEVHRYAVNSEGHRFLAASGEPACRPVLYGRVEILLPGEYILGFDVYWPPFADGKSDAVCRCPMLVGGGIDHADHCPEGGGR